MGLAGCWLQVCVAVCTQMFGRGGGVVSHTWRHKCLPQWQTWLHRSPFSTCNRKLASNEVGVLVRLDFGAGWDRGRGQDILSVPWQHSLYTVLTTQMQESGICMKARQP